MTGTAASVNRVDGAWAQTGTLTFNRPMDGADRVYEQVTEVPPVTIPRAGIWEVGYNARTVVSMPLNVAGGEYVTTALFKNGALIVGSEVLSGIAVGAGPASTQQETQGLSFVHAFAAGDVVTLHAFRIGQTGTASIVSNTDGRTRIAAHWLAPEGDTAT